ncbi:SGNH/GDSL hydrolase family protein [Aspergillus undulatus]|uniref:SGNH/GDSL hydrolase family protein n=1 Tax=Aspergillus undulatus TaxID=1810928 RepID=UPI003CCDEC99
MRHSRSLHRETPWGIHHLVWTGTAADGINWVGYLTTTYNDTLVLNYNPAVYGATIDNDIVANIPEDLVYQVEEVFEPNYCGSGSGPNSRNTRTETKTRTRTGQEWNPDSTLFSLWIGINDIYFLSLRPDPYQDMHCAIVRYFELINKLHTCGARNFLIFNVPPCDRSPHVLAYEPKAREEYNEVTVEYNAQLSNAIDAWSEDHPDSSVVAYDSWSFFTEVLDHPEVYGFTDGTSIGSGEKYVWWDDFHPTSAFHRFLAQDVGKFLGWTDE